MDTYDFSVRSLPTSAPSFHRTVTVAAWKESEPFATEDFGPETMEVQTGDLIYDRESRGVKYVAANKALIDVANIAIKNDSSSVSQRSLEIQHWILIVNILLICSLAIWYYAYRRPAVTGPFRTRASAHSAASWQDRGLALRRLIMYIAFRVLLKTT